MSLFNVQSCSQAMRVLSRLSLWYSIASAHNKTRFICSICVEMFILVHMSNLFTLYGYWNGKHCKCKSCWSKYCMFSNTKTWFYYICAHKWDSDKNAIHDEWFQNGSNTGRSKYQFDSKLLQSHNFSICSILFITLSNNMALTWKTLLTYRGSLSFMDFVYDHQLCALVVKFTNIHQ